MSFRADEEAADAEHRNDDAGCAHGEEELATLAIHQRHAHDGHEEVHGGEDDVTPMGEDVGEAALQQDVGVVADDGVDAGGGVAEPG